MSKFYIVALVPDRSKPRKDDGSYHLRDHTLNDYGPYETGKEAAEGAESASYHTGYKCQPRRIAQNDTSWIDREKERQADGYYMNLPKGWRLEPIENHFAVLDGKMISYFVDHAAGVLCRRTKIKVGRYLEQFYPHLEDAEKRRLTALIDPPIEVLFAHTAEEIVQVYTNGPDSCMAKSVRTWGTTRHPAEFYAGGDLAVAYLKKGNERASARAVVWPERKLYGRLYGDIERLKQGLHELGYTKTDLFVDAKVSPIPHPKQRGTKDADEYFMVPYFDNVQYVKQMPDGTFVTTTSEEACSEKNKDFWFIPGGGTGAMAARQRYCPKLRSVTCGPFMRVHGVDEDWSQQAVNYYTFQCQGSNERWPSDRKYQVELDNDATWSKRHFDEHGFTCAATGKKLPLTEAVTLGDGRRVTRDYARKLERMAARSSVYADVVAAQRSAEARAISGIVVPEADAPKPKKTTRKTVPVFANVPTHPGPALSTSNLRRRSTTSAGTGVTIGGVTIGL